MRYILASQSPRRRELLGLILDEFEICPADADETLRPGAPLEEEIVRLSAAKALAVAKDAPDAVVIGSDTMVAIGDEVLGKPHDAADAVRMLRRLSGATHRVLTGVAVVRGEQVKTALSVTEVDFRALSEEEIARYVASGEPLDKAGAYGIQGKGAVLVRGIRGDFYTVMGLPVARLYELLTN